MMLVGEKEASDIMMKFKSIIVLGVYPNTHYEGGLVRAVYEFPDNADFDEFEDAAQDAVKAAFPGVTVDRRVMIARLKR